MPGDIVDNFIFLRPAWLLAIPAVLLWLWALSKRAQSAGWHRYLTPKNISALRVKTPARTYYRYFVAPLVIGCIALAGPALTSNPTDVANSGHARVLVFDLSPSMMARDIKPDRLTQARYKTIDLLRQHSDGDIALLVYAKNVYRVTPLTDDPATIEALIPTLHPDIMPVAGSNTEAAVAAALELLQTADSTSGDILLITDGISDTALQNIKRLPLSGYSLSILGIGTIAGATVPTEAGVLTDALQQPIIAALNSDALHDLATHYNGRYTRWTADSSDVERLVVRPDSTARMVMSSNDSSQFTPGTDSPTAHPQEFDRYRDLGYLLLPLLMVLAVLAFRKNVLYALAPLILISPMDAKSLELSPWWQNDNQRALTHLKRGNVDEAYHGFTRSDWKAVAAYQRGNFEEAARLLATPVYAEDLYNRGKAQAMSGDLQAAIKSFTQALLLYSESEVDKREDTQHNITIIKALIDRNNDDNQNDDGPQNATANDNTRTRIDGEDETSDESEEDSTQATIGGATGPGQTLNQRSLSENPGDNSSAQAEPVQPSDLPDDANVRQTPEEQQQDARSQTPENNATSDLIVPTEFEDNNRAVLSPYSEQFLRDLPQDPGGYLRRKFLYQHQTNSQRTNDTPTEVRY
jgi:Ca-activated chloride channel family protein